jgi:hypothetical protein
MQIAGDDLPAHSWATVERELARQWRRAARDAQGPWYRWKNWLRPSLSESDLLADWTTILRCAPWVG